MKQRQLPPTGGGPPIIAAGGRPVSVRRAAAPAPVTLTLSATPESEAAGREVLNRIRDACGRDDIELLSSLVVLFPSVVSRTPDFHGLMHELVRNKKERIIAKIFRTPGRRGPKPQDEFHLIALVEHVMETEQLRHATEAIARLAEIFDEERPNVQPGETPLPFLPDDKTLQNRHSTLHKLFRLWSGSIYVPADLLTAQPWTPPGYQPEPPNLVATRLSNAIVFHAPDDKVKEPKKEN